MSHRQVAIVGAAGSGKTWLTQALSGALRAKGHAVWVPDTSCASLSSPSHGLALAQVGWVVTEGGFPTSAPGGDRMTLLMGLDLPGAGAQQLREDSLMRQALSLTQAPFKIVYGRGMDRLNNALLALGLTHDPTQTGQGRESLQFNINQGRDAWQCNDCSDPACEHKLFTSLLGKRSG